MKTAIQIFLLEWEPTDAVNADVSIALWNTDGLPDTSIFDGMIKISTGSFRYTIDEEVFDMTTGENHLLVDIVSNVGWTNGDANPLMDITRALIRYDETGQLQLETFNYVTLSKNTDSLDTNHVVYLDRTEYYNGGAQIFWDTSDVSDVTDVTTAEYIYSGSTREEFCMFPTQTGGYLKVKRSTVADYEGVDGTVVIDCSMQTKFPGTYMSVYLSENDTSAGTLLGTISPTLSYASSAVYRRNLLVPTGLMRSVSDASFAGMTLSMQNDTTMESWWQIFDSVFKYTPLTKADTDTTHSALVTDSTVPTIWRAVNTSHRARIKKGAYYVIEYYTRNDWWDFDG